MEAQKLYIAGDVSSALMMYLLLSELGFEVAQSNAAYILDQGKVSILTLYYICTLEPQSCMCCSWYQRSVDDCHTYHCCVYHGQWQTSGKNLVGRGEG